MKSLKSRIMLIFSILFCLSTALLSYFLYTSTEKMMIGTASDQASWIAQKSEELIDPEQYKTITPETGANEYYRNLRLKLNDIRETNGLEYLFTMNRGKNPQGKYEYYYVVDGMPLDSDDASSIGEVEKNEYPALERAFSSRKAQLGEFSVDEKYGALITAYVPILDEKGEVAGVVGADFNATKIYEHLKSEKKKIIIITGAFILFSLLIIHAAVTFLIQPLIQLIGKVRLVQEGSLSVELQSTRKDEIGHLTMAFRELTHHLKGMLGAITKNSVSVNESSAILKEMAHNAAATSSELAGGMAEISASASRQESIIEDAGRILSETGGAVSEIDRRLQEVRLSTDKALTLSSEGVEKVRKAIGQINVISDAQEQTSSVMRELEHKSKSIGEIVNAITGIAKQTNLLALNASIEASRAGEHGKGFAVVAAEVKKLAEDSAQAAENVSVLIEEIQGQTAAALLSIGQGTAEVQSGTSLVAESGQSFYQIADSIEQISAFLNSLSDSTHKIVEGSRRSVAIMEEVSAIARESKSALSSFGDQVDMQKNLIEEMDISTEKLKGMAQGLEDLANHFQTE